MVEQNICSAIEAITMSCPTVQFFRSCPILRGVVTARRSGFANTSEVRNHFNRSYEIWPIQTQSDLWNSP